MAARPNLSLSHLAILVAGHTIANTKKFVLLLNLSQCKYKYLVPSKMTFLDYTQVTATFIT